jgi:hypothetical protein
MSNPHYRENLPAVQPELEEAATLLSAEENRFAGSYLPPDNGPIFSPPELRTVEVDRPFWRIAIFAAVLSGVVFAGLALIPWSPSSPWLEAALNFISSVGAGLLSIKVNDVFIERSQEHLEFTEDVQVRRKRRWVLRRSHDRKTPSRGT